MMAMVMMMTIMTMVVIMVVMMMVTLMKPDDIFRVSIFSRYCPRGMIPARCPDPHGDPTQGCPWDNRDQSFASTARRSASWVIVVVILV